jgi:hypothetical protein
VLLQKILDRIQGLLVLLTILFCLLRLLFDDVGEGGDLNGQAGQRILGPISKAAKSSLPRHQHVPVEICGKKTMWKVSLQGIRQRSSITHLQPRPIRSEGSE